MQRGSNADLEHRQHLDLSVRFDAGFRCFNALFARGKRVTVVLRLDPRYESYSTRRIDIGIEVFVSFLHWKFFIVTRNIFDDMHATAF